MNIMIELINLYYTRTINPDYVFTKYIINC